MIELEPEPWDTEQGKNQEWIESFQTAVLLSLFERGELTKRQFDLCVDELQKQYKNV